MKRLLAALAMFLAWNLSGFVNAQETADNELELVRQLAAKGWTELARTRIEALAKRNDPVLNAALPLEAANVDIAEAKTKEPDQRVALFAAARAQLEKYIQQNQGKVGAARASAQLARLTSYQAQALLSKAMREEDAKTRHEKARPAETMFLQAGKDLDAAVKALEAAIANAPPDTKALLTSELKETKFHVAVNIFDQARTYIDRSKLAVDAQRGKTLFKARDAFAAMRTNDGSEIDWLANAWLMKIGMETTTPADVTKYYEYIMKWKDDKASQATIRPALRLIRYFAIQDLTPLRPEEPETIGLNYIAEKAKKKLSPVQRLQQVQKDGEAWLRDFSTEAERKSYEGQGVLFEIGMAHMIEAQLEKDQKKAGPHYDTAIKRFDELAKLDGDLAERARNMSLSIKFKRIDTTAELTTFDEFLMKAMIERTHFLKLTATLEDPKLGDKKKIEDDRQKKLKDVIAALTKALSLTTNDTPVAKVDDARFYLCGAYLAAGDPYRAAVVGETLGRARTTRRATDGAATAIQTYAVLASRDPKNESTRKRLFDLAEFALSQKNWAGDPVISLAHYHLGMAERERNPKKALGHLEKLTPDFVDYIYTQGQLVFIAESLREKTEDKKEKAYYLAAAKAAITRMPKVNPSGDSPHVVTMYFYAKLEMAKYLYMDAFEELNAKQELKAIAKCKEMSAYVRALQAELDPVPGKSLSPKDRDQLNFGMKVWLKYADLGMAEAIFRGDAKDRFDKVLEATKAVVGDALAKAKAAPANEKIRLKDYRVTGDILNLALRANVQKGEVKGGIAILEVLQRLTDENGETAGNVVGGLLNDIAGQIKRMTETNDPNLKVAKGNYTTFLDVIAKEYEGKGLDTNAALLLAHAYNSLSYPCKAAPMFAKIKAPAWLEKPLAKKTGKEKQEELDARQKQEEELTRHWAIQIDYIRALRACKDKDSLDTAGKVVTAMIDHPNSRFTIQAMMERNLLLEDMQRYAGAFQGWKKFLEMPVFRDLSKAEVQKVFYTSQVHWCRSLFKIATLEPKVKDKDRPLYITNAAKMIIRIETLKTREGWEIAGPLFLEMLKDPDYKKLKEEYDKQKLELKKGSSLSLPGSAERAFAGLMMDDDRTFETRRPQRSQSSQLPEHYLFPRSLRFECVTASPV